MRVGIALGSNLGDRAAHLRTAVETIRRIAEPPVLVSRVYETEPVNCPPGSQPFLNAAVEIGYPGDLHALLRQLQSIEQAAGRPEIRPKNSPRAIDLDILYADALRLDTPDLVLPHPLLTTRFFVLFPLNDIVPERCLPGIPQSISELAKSLDFKEYKISHLVLNK